MSLRASPARPPARRGRPGGRHALLVIATMLAASGLIRVGDSAGRAFASEGEAPAEPADAEQALCTPDGGGLALLEAARERDRQVAEREARVADRERAIEVARAEIDTRLAELAAAEAALARTISIADEAAEKDIARLVTVYENMKPKEAAPLFQEMAPEFAAGFLARMRPDAAAAILSGLDPQKGYMISAILAGRNANAPTD